MTGGVAVLFDARSGGNSQFQVQMQKSGGNYQLQLQARDNNGVWQPTTAVWKTITDAAHILDVQWTAAASGTAILSIDGLQAQKLTGFDNSSLRVDEVRLGMLAQTPGGMSGAMYFDGFQSWSGWSQAYTTTETEYAVTMNTTSNPVVWILDKVRRQVVRGIADTLLSETRYAYDTNAPGSDANALTKGELKYTQTVSGSSGITTGYAYDTYGNVMAACAYKSYVTPGNLPGTACSTSTSSSYHLSKTVYDTTLQTYPVQSINPLNHTATTVYDLYLAVPTSATDINGNITATAYDGLGRATGVTYPGGYTQPNVKYFYPPVVSGAVTPPFKVELQAWDETASPQQYRSAWAFYDGLGRTIQTQGLMENATQISVADTEYGPLGQTKYSGLPRLVTGSGGTYAAVTWASQPKTAMTYDALGRVTKTTFADGTCTAAAYDGLSTSFYDQNLHKKEQVVDGFGRLVTVKEYTGTGGANCASAALTVYSTTTYSYDERNLLTQVTDTAGNVTTIGYDGFGRKTSMNDPDMGAWTYSYNALSQLTGQTDARNTTLSFVYDSLGRLKQKWQGPVTTGALLASFTYDAFTAGSNYGKGRRTGMTWGGDSASWTYNALGQMKDETRVISGVTYKTCNTYDSFGRVRTQKYPATSNCTGETLNYSYNATGNLESVIGTATYVSNMDYDEFGQVAATYLNTGNIVSQPCYAANNRRIVAIRAYTGALQSCTVANPTNSKLNLKYTYFNNGNVQQFVDQTRNETLNYSYDDLDRLLSVSGAYSQSFSYNAIGNFIAKAGVTHTYNANSPATGCVAGTASTKPHAAQQAGTDTYVYDCNGSMTSRVESGTTYTQNFNAENMMTSVVTGGQTTTFMYDGDNKLMKKINPNGTYTVYIGGLYEVEYSAGNAVTKKTSYYPGGAMRVDIVGGSNTLYYMLKDHLGSASTLLDTNGNVVANGEQRYYPFGEKRITSADLKTAHLFTGQLEVGLGGIYSYGARMYSPRLGRFLSADTVVPGFVNPQNLNRYSYARNNPLRYSDPSGHGPCDIANLPWCKDTGDARQYDDCWIQGQVRNALCNNNNWMLDVNGEGVPVFDTIITQTPAQSPVFGVIGLVAQAQGQKDDEEKGGGGSGAAAGGGGGGGGDRRKQIEEFLQDIADQAARKIKAKGRVAGTQAHTYAENMIKNRQAGGEFMELSIEQSYAAGKPVGYGESGSVRLDVVVGDLKTPTAVYDFKFGGAKLSNSRIGQIRKVAGFAEDVIIRPIFGGRAVPR